MKTTAKRPSVAALPKTQLTLRVLYSGEAGPASRPPHPLPPGATRIGRALSGPGLLLDQDDQVSRLHATIHRAPEGLRLVDEQSRNGSFINGQRVSADDPSSGRLSEGDVIRLGDSFILVRSEPLLPSDAAIPELIGRSPAAVALRGAIKQVAPTMAMVLLQGESGTGKEVVARAIHALSGRSGPFIAINCSAIPETLAESQLFGHAKGAFTDARGDRAGLFVQASTGTLFLDEIGDMPLPMQVKLLRAVEERKVRPIGGSREVPFDARIVAATNRDLETEIAEKRFREDLYFRINVIHVELPPLRARGNDVLLLAQDFIERFAATTGKRVTGLSTQAAEKLLAYSFMGNVRELLNCIERAVAVTHFEQLTVDDLPERIRNYRVSPVIVASDDPNELVPMEEVERRYIARVLEAARGNKTLAARILGFDRKTLYNKMARYKLDAPD